MTQPAMSLILTWKIAAIEAVNLKQATIAPAHFFISLLKIIDIDLNKFFEKQSADFSQEVWKDILLLKDCIGEFILEVAAARRFLRAILPQGDEEHSSPESPALSRSRASRVVFDEAEILAQEAGVPVAPMHFLVALLHSGDAPMETMLGKINVNTRDFASYCENFVSHRT
jgi:hypothetical protein